MNARLIINADDFAYFDGVSEGILDAIGAGTVTATGVMANAPGFDRWAAALKLRQEVDVGVHLNATYGEPLTPGLATLLGFNGGQLPRKMKIAGLVLTGRIPVAIMLAEWRAQIERCVAAGLTIRFLNSHEHTHMHPRLYPVIKQLAGEFNVPFVRHTNAEFDLPASPTALLRGLMVTALSHLQTAVAKTPQLLGVAPSGHLDMAYVHRMLPRLRAGRSYELMCHPGRTDATASADPLLRNYHDWTGELRCLLSAEFRDALGSVDKVRFRDLIA